MLKIEQIECTGCGACFNVCPHHAISMQAGSEGFLYPAVDADACVGCGLCEKTCPVINPRYDHAVKPECYAAMADDDIRSKSSSGGVFTLLAQNVLKQGGVVCGAAYDEHMAVEHILVENEEGLERLRRSKYAQSTTGDCFSRIKKLLIAGRPVLFSGTPCQVAGLRGYLRKDYDNLLCVDIICHGVPSPKVFHKYLSELGLDGQVKDVNFRDKAKGWSTAAHLKISTDKDSYSIESAKDTYMQLFLNDISVRKSCSVCPFNRLPRQGDLTIGDFWRIDACRKAYNDKKGTSVILKNNAKGGVALGKIKKYFKLLKAVNLKYALAGNPVLTEPFKKHHNRKNFFDNLDKMTLEDNLKSCQEEHFDVAVLNYWWSLNYGAVLTAYALQQSLKEWGYSNRLVTYIHDWCRPNYHGSYTQIFADRYLDITRTYKTPGELAKLNKAADTFIVGSDQVFRPKYTRDSNFYFYLPFADPEKKKISCSASFGLDKLDASSRDKPLLRYYLSCFDAVSVREKSGIDVCREELGYDKAEQILDPVFWFDAGRWDELIKNSLKRGEGFGLSYVLDRHPETVEIVQAVEQKFGVSEIVDMGNAQKDDNVTMSPEDWLYHIKNCRYLVTDSFHGVCFAIIFNKPFVCIVNPERGASRFESLLGLLGLENRLLSRGEDVNQRPELFESVDYETVNKKLSAEAERSILWMQNALKQPKSNTGNGENAIIAMLIRQMNAQKAEQWRLEERLNETGKLLVKSGILGSLKRRCLRYKLLSALTLGKTRKKYKEKRKQCKQKIRGLKSMLLGEQ